MIRAILVLALSLLIPPGGADAQARPADQACGQEPGTRFFWIERAFCDMPAHGPERAHGVVIWNHGIHSTIQSWAYPAAPVLRVLQARGWDVIMLKRHHLAETVAGGPLGRTVERTVQEIVAQRKAGYKKVVLAGQSFGGYVTLDALESSKDVFAVVALAPGVRFASADGALDPTVIERILQRARVGRLALVFPKDDTVFGSIARGERVHPILARRDVPYLMVDEKSEITGHGGGMTGRFALRYGACLAEFLSADTVPAGRFECPSAADDWRTVQDLLMAADGMPKLLADGSRLPSGLSDLIGPRWALVGDSVVLVAAVDDAAGPRLLYRSTGITGGVLDATIVAGSIRAVLPTKTTVTLSPDNDGTITLTTTDGRTVKARLLRGTLARE